MPVAVLQPASVKRMADLPEVLEPLVRGLACRVLRPGTAGDNFLFGTYDFSGNAVPNPEKDRERENARRFLDCDPLTPDDSRYFPEGIPGTIGQCPTPYNFKGTYKTRTAAGVEGTVNFSQGGSRTDRRYGPHRGFRVGKDEQGNEALYQLASDARGNSVEYLVGTQSGAGTEIFDPVLTSATRHDGEPDNCGNAGDPRPRFDGNVDYDGSDGQPRTDPVTIIFDLPRTNPGGGISIPVDISLPGFSVDGEYEIDFSPSLDLSPSGSCDRPIAPPLDTPVIPDDAPPPPPDEYQPIVGVVATTTILSPFSSATEYGDGQPPTIYFPGLSQIMFAFSVAGTRAWSRPYPVSLLQEYIAVEGELEAYDVRVVNSNGFSTSVQPVRLDKTVNVN